MVKILCEGNKTMKQNDNTNDNIKITTNENLTTNGMRKIPIGSNVLYKPADEPLSECNPDNGAFFEERSNPLSSKGN